MHGLCSSGARSRLFITRLPSQIQHLPKCSHAGTEWPSIAKKRGLHFTVRAESNDFKDILARVQTKAKELRDGGILRRFTWPSAPRMPQLDLSKRLDLSPDPEEGGLVAKAVQERSLGFGFSAGGMLFPYYIGVLEGLQGLGLATGNARGRLRYCASAEHTKMAGASAGSIIAVCHHSGLTSDVIAAACLELAQDCRENGTRGRLSQALEPFLDKLLPEDVHECCRGRAYVAVSKAFPRPQGYLVSDFRSRDDLIKSVLTSCHIPWWFDNSLTTNFRGSLHYDGGLTNFIPLAPALRAGIRVCCFPSKQVSPVYNIQISPDNFEEWPYTMKEMLGWAFEPAEEEILLNFISKGRADAEAWALQSGAADALKEASKAEAGLDAEGYPALKK